MNTNTRTTQNNHTAGKVAGVLGLLAICGVLIGGTTYYLRQQPDPEGRQTVPIQDPNAWKMTE